MKLPYQERIENPSDKERTDYIIHRTSWLFRRSNYFVVGMTFLVAALAAVVSSQCFALRLSGEYVAWLILLLCACGYTLSFFFMVINHLESIIIAQLQKCIDKKPSRPLFEWANVKAWPKGLDESRGPILDMMRALTHPAAVQSQTAPHTYMIPLGFWIFWLILPLIIVPPLRQELNKFGWVFFGYVAVSSLAMYARVYGHRAKLKCNNKILQKVVQRKSVT